MMMPLCRPNKRILLYNATWKVEAVNHERMHNSKITMNYTIRVAPILFIGFIILFGLKINPIVIISLIILYDA